MKTSKEVPETSDLRGDHKGVSQESSNREQENFKFKVGKDGMEVLVGKFSTLVLIALAIILLFLLIVIWLFHG